MPEAMGSSFAFELNSYQEVEEIPWHQHTRGALQSEPSGVILTLETKIVHFGKYKEKQKRASCYPSFRGQRGQCSLSLNGESPPIWVGDTEKLP